MALTLSQVEALYIGYFGRAGDPNGVNYWLGDPGGLSYGQIAASFSVQAEATAMYPFLANPLVADPGQFVDQVYQNLFNHAPDAAGRAYWIGQLTASAGNPQAVGQFILNVISGAQGADATAIANKEAVADYFTTHLANANIPFNSASSAEAHSVVGSTDSTSASVTAAEANVDAFISTTPTNVGETVALTTAVDILAGTPQNDTFIGLLDTTTTSSDTTAQVADHIDGGAGTDTLDITVVGNDYAEFFLPHTTNVENLIIETATSTGVELYADFMTGLKSITFEHTSEETLIFNVANLVDVNIVNPTTDTNEYVQFVSGVAGAGTSINLAVQGTTAPDGDSQYVALFDSSSAYFETYNIISTGGANNIDLAIGAETKTIHITGSTALMLDTSQSYTDHLATIDASGMTGGGLTVFIEGTHVSSIVGSGFADTVLLDADLAVGANVNLGAGNDAFLDNNNLGPAAVAASDVIDGGAGIDTMSISLANAGNGGAFHNFEIVDAVHTNTATTIDVGALLPNSSISGVAVSGNLGANVTLTDLGFSNGLLVTGAPDDWSLTLGFNGTSGTSDSLGVAFNDTKDTGTTVEFATLKVNGIETVAISSGGSHSNLNEINTLSDSALKAITISGATPFDLNAIVDNTGGGNSATTLTTVDGSTASGALGLNISDQGTQQAGSGVANYTLAISGGSGNDGISVVETAGFAKVGTFNINLASGGNDVINDGVLTGTAFSASAAGSIVNITGANAGDAINFESNFDNAIHNVNVSTALNLGAALTTAAASTSAGNDLAWFTFAGNTYILDDVNNNGAFDANDSVVKLVGSYDLANHATIVTGVVTLA